MTKGNKTSLKPYKRGVTFQVSNDIAI